MPTLNKKRLLLVSALGMNGLLAGCAGFTGFRTPIYDGEPIVYDEEAVSTYQNHSEVIGEEKALYLDQSFSPDLQAASLGFSGEESVLLEEGAYIVGEDLPSGRAVLHGADSDFTPNMRIIHIGNVAIYDENEELYFESLFNDASGIKDAVVDLREGHSIEIIGENPEITITFEQSADLSSEGRLISGQYEVGKHIDPGQYEISTITAPRTTVMYWFQGEEEPRVIELTANQATMTEGELNEERENLYLNDTEYQLELDNIRREKANRPVIDLEAGDKLYLPMLHSLELTKAE